MNHTPDHNFSGGHTTAASIGPAPSAPLSPLPDVTADGPSHLIAPTDSNAGRGETFPAPHDTDTQPQRPLSGTVASSAAPDLIFSQAAAGWNPAAMGPAMLSEENSGTVEETASSVAVDSPHETPAPPALIPSGENPAVSGECDFRRAPTAGELEEQNRRLNLLETFEALQAHGLSKTAAARQLGQSYVTLWRWTARYQKNGRPGLLPDTANSGRPSGFAALLADPAFCAKLIELYTATIGASGANVTKGRRTAKAATALLCFADEPECPPDLARHLRKGKLPTCFLRWLKRITPEIEQRLRGAKHFQLNGLASRRDLTVRFPDGTRGDLPAGYKWVFDDMSVNQPFWAQVDGRLLFSRQGLYCVDQRSLRWLGKMLVARPREAYRAEDILRFLRLLFGLYGKPDVIVFERGVWHSRKIRGLKLTDPGTIVDELMARPEMPEAERVLISQGLHAIGVRTIFATSAHGKVIETCFNHLQTVLAIKARQFVNIGRHAGEFETAAKRLRQVRAYGKSDGANGRNPADLGFAPMSELSERIDAAFTHINGKINSRDEVPDEIWTRDLAARPLAALLPGDAHVFLPETREREIRDGRVVLTVAGVTHDFRADWMVELGTGYKVYVRFDPAEPTLGAAIYNRETGTNNRRLDSALPAPHSAPAYHDGELIGLAAWECPGPNVDVPGPVRGITAQPLADYYGEGAEDNGDAERRKQTKLVATAFSAMPRPGLPAVKSSEARDGEGRVVRRTQGDTAGQLSPTGSRAAAPLPSALGPRPATMLRPATSEQFTKQSDRLAKQAAHARSLRELTEA